MNILLRKSSERNLYLQHFAQKNKWKERYFHRRYLNLSLLKERVGVRIVPSREIDLVHKWGYKSLSSRVVQHCYCIYEGVRL